MLTPYPNSKVAGRKKQSPSSSPPLFVVLKNEMNAEIVKNKRKIKLYP